QPAAKRPIPSDLHPAPQPGLQIGFGLGAGETVRLFDRVARHYDRINRTMSLGLGERYRRDALLRAGIRPGMRVLDVGSGTGVLAQFARDAVGASGAVAAVDPSAAMLDVARRRGVRDACRGVAESLPYRDASFDLVTMAYALRHVADLGRTFAE